MNIEDSTLAVLIPVRIKAGNSSLQRCLESVLMAKRKNFKWKRINAVIIDDRSDVSVEDSIPNYLLSDIAVIRNGRAAGQAGALNYGIQNVQADVYAFTDSDCVVDGDWFSALASAYATPPHPGGIAGPNWLHQKGDGVWSRWLTKQESQLVRTMFSQYVDGQSRTTRFDCRNFSITKTLLNLLTASDSVFFVEGAGPSVSGLTSTRWRDQLRTVEKGIRFHSELGVRHEAVHSLREEACRYFRWGRDGRYSELYRAGHGSLLEAFLQCHFRRHFISPVLKRQVAPVYIWTVHVAYWLGIAMEALRSRKSR